MTGSIASADAPCVVTAYFCPQLVKGRERHEYAVTVTAKGGEGRTFTLPLAPHFTSFHWIGIHSCGDRGRYFIDDFKIVDRNLPVQ